MSRVANHLLSEARVPLRGVPQTKRKSRRGYGDVLWPTRRRIPCCTSSRPIRPLRASEVYFYATTTNSLAQSSDSLHYVSYHLSSMKSQTISVQVVRRRRCTTLRRISAHECIATAFEYADSSTPTRGDTLLAPMWRSFASGFISGMRVTLQ